MQRSQYMVRARVRSHSSQPPTPRETQATTHRHLQRTTPRRAHVQRGTSSKTNHAPHSKHPPHARNPYLCSRRNPTKKGHPAKTCSTKRKMRSMIGSTHPSSTSSVRRRTNSKWTPITSAPAPRSPSPSTARLSVLLRSDSVAPSARVASAPDMQVSLTNDGPVTIWIDSKARE